MLSLSLHHKSRTIIIHIIIHIIHIIKFGLATQSFKYITNDF